MKNNILKRYDIFQIKEIKIKSFQHIEKNKTSLFLDKLPWNLQEN